MSKLSIKEYSWVVRGKQRRDIIQHMKDADTPTLIASKSSYSLNNTSRVLNEFIKKDIAKCLNPKQKTGRLYVLTAKGKRIQNKMIKSS